MKIGNTLRKTDRNRIIYLKQVRSYPLQLEHLYFNPVKHLLVYVVVK